jgi:hypothetical protein
MRNDIDWVRAQGVLDALTDLHAALDQRDEARAALARVYEVVTMPDGSPGSIDGADAWTLCRRVLTAMENYAEPTPSPSTMPTEPTTCSKCGQTIRARPSLLFEQGWYWPGICPADRHAHSPKEESDAE